MPRKKKETPKKVQKPATPRVKKPIVKRAPKVVEKPKVKPVVEKTIKTEVKPPEPPKPKVVYQDGVRVIKILKSGHNRTHLLCLMENGTTVHITRVKF
jgi:hypothetical protein